MGGALAIPISCRTVGIGAPRLHPPYDTGLTRKLREGNLSRPEYTLICRHFESDWQACLRVELQESILALARDLIQRHPLRGFDAVHLASAVNLKSTLGEEITFAAADGRLLRAAQVENLDALNVETARFR